MTYVQTDLPWAAPDQGQSLVSMVALFKRLCKV